jgi:hypothetical protein
MFSSTVKQADFWLQSRYILIVDIAEKPDQGLLFHTKFINPYRNKTL